MNRIFFVSTGGVWKKIFHGLVMEKRSECRSMTHWFSTADGKVFLQMGIEFSGGFPWWSMEKYSTFRPMEKRWKRRRRKPISPVEKFLVKLAATAARKFSVKPFLKGLRSPEAEPHELCSCHGA